MTAEVWENFNALGTIIVSFAAIVWAGNATLPPPGVLGVEPKPWLQ